MDVVERLTLEAAQEDTMLASEHRQRYQFAAALCEGRRVLDLCCGSGYGTRILAASAGSVLGVDNDVATVDTAQLRVGEAVANASFEAADAIEFLGRDQARQFEVIVCFEGLEHLEQPERALELMRSLAERGTQLIVSVPNDQLFGEENPFHFTEFGYDRARRAFAAFPRTTMVPQYLAEGSVICPPGADEVDLTLDLDGRDEPEYANHFIFCVGFHPDAVERVHRGQLRLSASPIFNRWSEDLKRGAWALRRENARLARIHLGKGGSAAASALAGLADREAQVGAWQERARAAEERVKELEALLADALNSRRVGPGPGPRGEPEQVPAADGEVTAVDGSPPPLEPGEDPNSWEQRRRRAATVLVPWIEQTVPLAGKTVLEYGCGNAAVSSAVAERAGRVIGVDIDPDGIELGSREIAARGLGNVELQLYPLDSIVESVRARRGEVDVFLLYAVLEHLTLEERLQIVRLAREVVRPDGAIVVCETPNRLIYFDHHTARMPFFHLLPDALAAEYYPRSSREDFKAAIDAAAARGPEARLEAIIRWGRGVSFHEFEAVFGDLSRHVLASSYDPILFPERPVHPDEVILSRYLDRWRPDLAPAWSRYWLDVILTPEPLERRAPFLRPWTADTHGSSGVSWTRWETLRLEGPEARLEVRLPHPSPRLVVGVVTDDGAPVNLHAAPGGGEAKLTGHADKPPHHPTYLSFSLPRAESSFAISANRLCYVTFVGYED